MIEITCRACHCPVKVQSRKQKLCYLCRSKAERKRRADQNEERRSQSGYNRASRRKASESRSSDSYPKRIKLEIKILLTSGVKNGLDCNSVTADEIIRGYHG